MSVGVDAHLRCQEPRCARLRLETSLRASHRPGRVQLQNCTTNGDNAQRPVGADDPVRPLGVHGFAATYHKNGRAYRRGRCGHRPLQTVCVFAEVHPCLQVRAAGRTEASAPTGACRFALVHSILQRYAARAGQAPPLRYDETRGSPEITTRPLISRPRRQLPPSGKPWKNESLPIWGGFLLTYSRNSAAILRRGGRCRGALRYARSCRRPARRAHRRQRHSP
mgnify:CR=1 FL=1